MLPRPPLWAIPALLICALYLASPGGSASASAAAPPLDLEAVARAAQALEPAAGGHRAAPARDEPLLPGTSAIVRADGGCLRLRALASLSAEVLTCMPEGTIVSVLHGVHEDAEYRWQQVQQGSRVGWVADDFLEPAPESPGCDVAAASVSPGLRGSVPASGIGAASWGGGTTNGVITAALADGCRVRSLWATAPGTGRLVGYLADVPAFVNREWNELFPDGPPAGAILLMVCGERVETQAASTLLPAWAPAPLKATQQAAPRISAATAVVIDEASGAVLYDKDAYRPVAPASLTKLVTAAVAIEGARLDGWVLSTVDSRRMPGSSVMGLVPGDCFQLRDLLYGLMLPSGNDAALAIGRHVAGSDAAFVAQMNTLVHRLGLSGSTFANAHGLDARGHQASAYDLAMIGRYGMSLPVFQQVVAQPTWVTVGSRTISMRNLNQFLAAYPGADGLKTGFTENAGRTLAVSATRDGKRLYAVVLNAPDRFEDVKKLLDWAFTNHTWP